MERDLERQSLKESIYELLYLSKVCLTSFWFWVPPLFALFVVLELYMICINPLLLIVGPAVIIVYALVWEDRRVRAQYGLKEIKIVKSGDMLFSGPRKVEQGVDVEKLVKEYTDMVKKKSKTAENGEKRSEDK